MSDLLRDPWVRERVERALAPYVGKLSEESLAWMREQLAHTRVQDNARVFLPGADREIGMAHADVMTGNAKDAQARFDQLKTTLEGIYNKEVKPKLG